METKGFIICSGAALASSFVDNFAPVMVAASVCGRRGEPARQSCEYAQRTWCCYFLFTRTCEAGKCALFLFKVTHPHNVWVV